MRDNAFDSAHGHWQTIPMPRKPYPKLKRSRRIRPRVYATRPRPANPTTNLRLQGIAAALATLAREHSEPDFAMMVLTSMDLSIADLERAGADSYDLEPLKAAWKIHAIAG